MPQITVITPAHIDTYDKLTWLKETIQSVQAQQFRDWELLIMDDASPVPLESLKTETYGDSRIRWFKMVENSGPSLCRNTAVALAESDAILPLDADDLLADERVLGNLYEAWKQNPKQVIYGDLQRLEGSQKGKSFNLPEYTFQKSLDLNGIMPVTAMHSVECHIKAGGWKQELQAGLEDVEYWIAAGKAGFCGRRIQGITLLYRRHDTSRFHQLRQVNRRENEMRNKIIGMHKDVYEGRYPMGCCGGGSSYVPPQNQQNQQQQMSISTPLTDFTDRDKTWIQYLGKREGGFSVVGDHTGIHYNIQGPGHKFEVHIHDAPKFRRSGRGLDFAIGTAPPVNTKPVLVEIPASNGPAPFQAPAPVQARIIQLDEVAARSRGVALPSQSAPANGAEMVRQPEPVPMLTESVSSDNLINSISGNYTNIGIGNGKQDFDLTPLELDKKVQEMLESESWTIQKLALADPEELKVYPGIGAKRASQIVEKAKGYLNV